MEVKSIYSWLAVGSLSMLVIVSWMVGAHFKPFIKLEEKVHYLFEKFFGHPQMTRADGPVSGVLTFLVTYGSAPFLSLASVVIAFFLFINHYRFLAIWLLGVVSTGGLFGVLLKKKFKRKRPIDHLSFDTGFSFPSGHAIASTLFFLTILLVLLPFIQVTVVRVLLSVFVTFIWFGILFSRLYFHAHHLGDLLVGVSLGVFWVMSAMLMYDWLNAWLTNFL